MNFARYYAVPCTLLLFSVGAVAQANMAKPIAVPQAKAPVQTPAPVATSDQPAADAQPAGAPLQLSPTYVIGAEDNLQITVWQQPTLSGSFPVRPDGMISIPLLGDVPAAGRMPMQLATEVTERLKKFVNDPTVSVSVVNMNSKRVYMMGEVGKIGPLPLMSQMNPLQAIASSGGLSPYANKTHIYILRMVNGKQVKLHFDYKKAIKDGDMQGIILQPGDTIVVP